MFCFATNTRFTSQFVLHNMSSQTKNETIWSEQVLIIRLFLTSHFVVKTFIHSVMKTFLVFQLRTIVFLESRKYRLNFFKYFFQGVIYLLSHKTLPTNELWWPIKIFDVHFFYVLCFLVVLETLHRLLIFDVGVCI